MSTTVVIVLCVAAYVTGVVGEYMVCKKALDARQDLQDKKLVELSNCLTVLSGRLDATCKQVNDIVADHQREAVRAISFPEDM